MLTVNNNLNDCPLYFCVTTGSSQGWVWIQGDEKINEQGSKITTKGRLLRWALCGLHCTTVMLQICQCCTIIIMVYHNSCTAFIYTTGGKAHPSRPPSRLHDDPCHDAVNGKTKKKVSPGVTPCYWRVMLPLISTHSSFIFQIGVTFAIVFGVILYRISTKAALYMSSNPVTRSNAQLTVKTTAAIINLVVILILDEVYGAVARWLTVLGKWKLCLCPLSP